MLVDVAINDTVHDVDETNITRLGIQLHQQIHR